MSTPTPITDEAWSSAFNAEDFSASSVARSMRVFSRKIEIELAAANEACRVASEDALLMRDDLYKQLAAATTERDHWQKIAVSASREREHNANVAQAMTAERDQLRAEVEQLKPYVSKAVLTHEGTMLCSPMVAVKYNEATKRAERAEADLDQVACARTDGILRESDLTCTLNMERKQFNKVKTALKDAISTYFGDDKLVTTERIEAWQAALKEDSK